MIKVGKYSLGFDNVDLYANPKGMGGAFWNRTKRIEVGIDYPVWNEVVNVVLHESLEYLLFRGGYRFINDLKETGDAGDYTFLFDHPGLSRLCKQQSYFLTYAMYDLNKVWRKNQKEKKKK